MMHNLNDELDFTSYLKGKQTNFRIPFTLYMNVKLLKKWTLENTKVIIRDYSVKLFLT